MTVDPPNPLRRPAATTSGATTRGRRSRTRALVAHLAGLIALSVLAACSGGDSGSAGMAEVAADRVPSVNDDPSGWMATSADEVMFVTWTDANGTLAGAVQFAEPDGAGAVTSASYPLTGARDGDDITLRIDGPLSTGAAWTGRIEGTTLVLAVPNDDGTLRELRLRRASIDDYNTAVGQARTASQRQADLAAEAAEQQAAAEAHAAAELAAARAWQGLVDAVDRLRRNTAEFRSRDFFASARADYAAALDDMVAEAAEFDSLVSGGAECFEIETGLVDVDAARTSVSVAHVSFESAVVDLEVWTGDLQWQIDDVVDRQRNVPTADHPTGIGRIVGDARAVIADASAEHRDMAAEVAAWDAQADSILAAATERAAGC